MEESERLELESSEPVRQKAALEDELYAWARRLCEYAGEDENYLESFFQKLLLHTAIYEEFAWFYEKQSFLCKTKIRGVTVVDVMVWQMDHFKARLDQESELRTNKDKMLLNAFATFLDMAEDPEKLISQMNAETGTDYPDKF